MTADAGPGVTRALAAAFFVVAVVFVWRSFYGMRIRVGSVGAEVRALAAPESVGMPDRPVGPDGRFRRVGV